MLISPIISFCVNLIIDAIYDEDLSQDLSTIHLSTAKKIYFSLFISFLF